MLHNGREIAPSVSWDILLHVKRSGGMSVNELAAVLKMSYMGVKQHCDELKKRGYVDTWRRPKQTGRPEKIYRPTDKLDLVLPNWGSDLCLGLLGLVSQAYGETVPERLLHGFLQQKVEHWNAKIKGRTPKERTMELAKLRNSEGWICQCVEDASGGLRLVDHHSPMAEVARLFPAVCDLEIRALSRIFGHTLLRRQNGGNVEFIIIEGEAPPPAAEPPPITLRKKRGADKKSPLPASRPQEPPTPVAPEAEQEVEAAPDFESDADSDSGYQREDGDEVAGENPSRLIAAEEASAPDFEEDSSSAPEVEDIGPAPERSPATPPEEPIPAFTDKPRKTTRSTKQTVKAGADRHQDLFDF